jgi:hypothetical protein
MTRGPAPSATSAAPTRSARQRRRARRRNAAAEPLPKVESLGVQARVRRPLPLRPPLLDHLRYAVCCIRGRRGKPSGRRKCRSQDHLDHGPPRAHATIWFESRWGTGARSPSLVVSTTIDRPAYRAVDAGGQRPTGRGSPRRDGLDPERRVPVRAPRSECRRSTARAAGRCPRRRRLGSARHRRPRSGPTRPTPSAPR